MRKSRYFLKICFFGAIVVLVVSILVIPDFFMYSGTDYGVYFNNGRLLSQGQIPYKDFWDHKTPGIYIYLALWQLIFGSGWFSAKASLIPIYVLWGVAIFAFSKITFKRNLPSIITALVGVYFVLRLGFDPARNGAILVLSTSVELLALSLIYRITMQTNIPQNNLHQIVIGILVGILSTIAFLIRQTSITPFLVLFFLLIFSHITKKKSRTLINFGSFAVGSLTIIMAAILLARVMRLTISDIYKPLIVYNRLYAEYYFSQPTIKAWMDILLSDIIWWVPTLVGVFVLILHRSDDRENANIKQTGLKFLYLCLGIAIFLTVLSIRPQNYYRIQYYPYLFIISFVVVLFIIETFPKHRSISATLSLVVSLLLMLPLFTIIKSDVSGIRNWYTTAKYYNFQVTDFPDQVIANQILQIPNSEKIFVYGNRAWIYVLTGAFSPNKYYYASSMFRKGYLSQNEFEMTLAELEATPPEVIVYWPNRPVISDAYDSSYIDEFERFVQTNYDLNELITISSSWPYGFNEPIAIYILLQD